MSGSGSGKPRRPGLLPSLSGRLAGGGAGAAGSGSGRLDPALREGWAAAAAHSKPRVAGAPYAAPWAALGPAGADRARSDATLHLLRQLSKPAPGSPGQSPPRPSDSARPSESSEGDSTGSTHGAAAGSAAGAASPFAAAPRPLLSAELLRGLPSPPAASPSIASTAADTAYHSAAGRGPHSRAASSYGGQADACHWEEGPGSLAAGGADTPRSAVSWYSLHGGLGALPQTEAELAQLDLGEVERVVAEAAELQERAAAALRLARRRLQAEPSGPGEALLAPAAEGGRQAAGAPAVVPRSRGGSPVAEPALHQAWGHEAELASGPTAGAAPPATPALLLLALQLLLLLTAAAEAALLWCAGAARRASGGALRLPRSLVLAPVSAARGGAFATLLAADVVLALLARPRSRPTP